MNKSKKLYLYRSGFSGGLNGIDPKTNENSEHKSYLKGYKSGIRAFKKGYGL